MITTKKKIQDLIAQEKKNKRQLKNKLFLLLSSQPKSRLPAALPLIATSLLAEIKAIGANARQLADRHSLTVLPAEPSERDLILAAAAMTLAAKAASALHLAATPSVSSQVKQALRMVDPTLSRIATTETFQAYQTKYISNHKDHANGYYLWLAVLDKRTCDVCAALDGKKWTDSEDVPDLPHLQCRCTVSFIEG